MSPVSVPGAGQPERVNGLVLIQFEGPVQPSWKAQLQAFGVELLAYVPEDAFVARAVGSRMDEIRARPFVRWIDRYHPEFRIERGLRHRLLQGIANQPERVSILASSVAAAGELAEIRSALQGDVHQSRHRTGTIVRGRLPVLQMERLINSPAVLWVESAPEMRLHDESSSQIVGGTGTNHATLTQNWGYDGRGVTVAVADSGLDNGQLTNHADLRGLTKALFYYGGLTSAADEHTHGTHVTGIIAGRGFTQEGDEFGYYGLGVAPAASIVVQRIFDGRGNYRGAPSQETLTRDAVRAGAQIANNSWGLDTQGRYDLSAFEFDGLVRDADLGTPGDQPFVLCFSAGNAGPGLQSITSPASGKNVIATGASQSARTNFLSYNDGPGAMADFSSRGPCEDGRIKPDLVAPGTWIASLLSSFGHQTNAWGPINNEYVLMGGTSQASPHVAGGAAVFFQYYRDRFSGSNPSPALVKAALIHSASPVDARRNVPNHDEGWGLLYLPSLVSPAAKPEFINQSVPLITTQVYQRLLVITDSNEPLRVTLAYTDYPGFPAALPALVNDLDLELTGPDGRSYGGNQFENGVSAPNPPGHDSINNVEGILLRNPVPGEYVLRVRARKVVQDSRVDTQAMDQDFALVISGGFPAPGAAVVLLDQSAYTAPDLIAIKVVDPIRAGASANITVRSQTESLGQMLTLAAAGTSGVFTGAIATAIGLPANDGRLQIAHGNWIQVEYLEASSATTRIANAFADLLPPVISQVTTTNQFGQFVITWTTDELSSSTVRYGTTPDLALSVTTDQQSVFHALEIPDLQSGQVYHYVVISTDTAGNTATNDNNGSGYGFVATTPATALVVDAYTPQPGETWIPLSTYTDTLDQIGITHEEWSVAELGMPTLNSLRSYSVVLWRVNDSPVANDAIAAEQQLAIQQYLEAGGSFMMCSMQILSRMLNQGSGGFLTNVLHVGKFLPNPSRSEYCENCDEDFRVPSITGVTNDQIGRGLTMTMDYSLYRDDQIRGPDLGDTFAPSTNAIAFLLESVSGKTCGMRYPQTGQDSPGRVVFVSVPLDAFPASGPFPNTRAVFLARSLQFLLPGLGGVGTIALNQNSYGIPDLITVEMADSDLEGQGAATVQIHSDSHTDPVAVPLVETRRPGLFRGYVSTLSATNPPAQDSMRVVHGDLVHATYFDVSTGEATADASIDSIAPELAGLLVRVGFIDATISWSTSEPTDALVQFGESPFFGRTVFRSEPATSHSIRLIGLVPDRIYYFKVTVRDLAGNISIDDNHGLFHQFQTVEPLVPSFSDSMENGPTNWTVLSSEVSQRHWELGTPLDGHTILGCCPSENAWGSNLDGKSAKIIDTYLISPGLDLTGGNVARLRFDHDYDFSGQTPFDVITQGELLIATNVLNEPLLLAVYTGYIPDYEPVEIDLTPYTGRIVFLIWRHHLLSTSPEQPPDRPGWVIDNVSVTLSNAPTGVIRVTNNLSQATFELRRSSLTRTGYGQNTTLSNMPSGQYEITFGTVDFYQRPLGQSNTLQPNQTITFGGLYTFADTNTNGMSDTWEWVNFGAVSPDRIRSTDTDSDGFTDFAEFVAGTSPILSTSALRITSPTHLVGSLIRIQWPSVPGRSYQLQGSRADGDWRPLTPWMRTIDYSSSVVLQEPAPGDPYIYRVQVMP